MNDKNDRAVNFIRFFFLGLAIALMILLGVLLFSIYRSSTREITDSDLVIVDDTEAVTEAETEKMTVAESETEEETVSVTETQTEAASDAAAAAETEAQTPAASPDADSGSAVAAETSVPDTSDTASDTSAQASSDTADASAVQSVEGDVVVITEETTAAEDTSSESTGVYSTLNAACNFRSEAGYEDADGNDTTIGIYQAGTQVEVLDASGGWTKVKIDGVVGYVGAQFVGDADSESE